ncbi:MAG: methionine synthase [Spirochaetes bacterium]|nr:MAG: methionine synthase [Spirochaetota bacterium]
MARRSIVEVIKSGRILLSDGGWGTSLQKRGLKAGECPEKWCIEREEEVFALAKSFIDAGSDIIETNSFGGTRFKLQMCGLGERVGEINEKAVRISRHAAGEDNWVMASAGPTGKMIIWGDVTGEDLYNAFKEQVEAQERGGADAVCIETMMALDEACIAVEAARDNTDLEIICTFSFEKNAKGEMRTMMGATPSEAAGAVIALGAHIVGANCGKGYDGMIDIIQQIRKVSEDIPILIQANAGIPKLVEGETVFPATSEEMAAQIPLWIEAGANIVGGCCGTTPEHIRAFRKAVDSFMQKGGEK